VLPSPAIQAVICYATQAAQYAVARGGGCNHLILDNYRIHSSLQTKAALARLEGRVVLHFLPPYCPDHNRIERVWRDLHANVTRNHQCRNMKQLMAEVHYWLAQENQRLQNRYSQKKAA